MAAHRPPPHGRRPGPHRRAARGGRRPGCRAGPRARAPDRGEGSWARAVDASRPRSFHGACGGLVPGVTYLTFDSIQEGIGVSQVLPYVEGLAATGVPMRLHTFERSAPRPDLVESLRRDGIDWVPHGWGRDGALGGALRLVRSRRGIRGDGLVHARGDVAAMAAAASRRPFVWDMRSFWLDERIEAGGVGARSVAARFLRRGRRAV